MFHPAFSGIALKEWAPTIKALGAGDQIVLVRTGDLLKEGQLAHREFFFYPDLEERSPSKIKPEFQKHLSMAVDEDDTPGLVFFSHWGEITSAFSLNNSQALDALFPHHIWTREYLQSITLQKALVVLVRVYSLVQPQAVPVMDYYEKCKGSIELIEEIPLGDITPVFSKQEYEKQAKSLEQMLGGSGAKKIT